MPEPITFYVPPLMPVTMLYAGIMAFLILLFIFLWRWIPKQAHFMSRIIPLAIIVIVMGVASAFMLPAYFANITILEDELKVSIPPFASLSLSKGEIMRAFTVDWNIDNPYKPVLRTYGASFMGYKAGWFKLAKGEKAVILSVNPRNLALETKHGYYVILGPPDFNRFLETFKLFHQIKE